ncbi:class I SAM-dependent methyltransferase [Sphaerisporangium sp. TRM90804]|uniref:class I SAM-dependent methyltransferase n=1 Tax=Sphaerisporangium sp. TRM90804 TaxID=3031113 RepID=UPI002447A2E1|nr:class I SAM-dependent methyltransferase [Sphaerisporangium sp. TRM90804]MDH2427238.1 class I SAM-dependent methyltransferase [Sphaerisporangium sp. TRM90804]
MIGRAPLQDEYLEWNRTWGAPYGRGPSAMVSFRRRLEKVDPDAYGPFAFQAQRGLKTFQYPWAYFTAGVRPGMRVMLSGEGLGGFQFVLAMNGLQVVNVDPTAAGEPARAHARINRAFGTDVRLVTDLSEAAALEQGSFDRVFLLSTLDHLGERAGRAVLESSAALLAPGGLCLITADLLLHLRPLGVLPEGPAERNVDLRRLTDGLGLELAHGDPRELYGFPEFDRGRVVEMLPEMFVGPFYPSVSQTAVLGKPG